MFGKRIRSGEGFVAFYWVSVHDRDFGDVTREVYLEECRKTASLGYGFAYVLLRHTR